MGSMSLMDAQPRVKIFLTTLGLNKNMSHAYCRHTGDFWGSVMRRTFDGDLKAVKERLDEAPDYISPSVAKGIVIGLKANASDPSTWDTPHLSMVATNDQIMDLLKAVEEVPKVEEGPSDVKGKVDMDAVWEIIFNQYMAWIKKAQQRIITS